MYCIVLYCIVLYCIVLSILFNYIVLMFHIISQMLRNVRKNALDSEQRFKQEIEQLQQEKSQVLCYFSIPYFIPLSQCFRWSKNL